MDSRIVADDETEQRLLGLVDGWGTMFHGALAVAFTALLGTRLPQQAVRILAAGGCLLFGTLLIIDGLTT